MAEVKLYTRKFCGYCTAAQQLLAQKQIPYTEIDATNDPPTRAWLAKETGQSTMPQIFIDGRSIGGYRELSALERSGQLDTLLGKS